MALNSRHRARARLISSTLLASLLVITGGCSWAMEGGGPERTGSSPDTAIGAANVAKLSPLYTAATAQEIKTAPAVANGVAYVGTNDGKLYAFSADGSTGCAHTPKTCAPLWTANVGTNLTSSPAVSNGVVYVGTLGGGVFAFDAAGQTGCHSSPKVCDALRVYSTGGSMFSMTSPPAISNGRLYVGNSDARLYVFDVTSTKNCGSPIAVCAPLWIGATDANVIAGTATPATFAVSGQRAYVVTSDNAISAFDTAASSGCGGNPRTCSPLWRASLGAAPPGSNISRPSVADGVVYVGGADHKLYAFDAAASSGCGGSPKTCAPLWTAVTGSGAVSPPAVANHTVYVGSLFTSYLYAFDGRGQTNCTGAAPLRTCSPLWYGSTGLYSVPSAPTVANGIVYTATYGGLLAFDTTAPIADCTSPGVKVCQPLFNSFQAFSVGAFDASEVAIVNGIAYVGGGGNQLWAFHAAA